MRDHSNPPMRPGETLKAVEQDKERQRLSPWFAEAIHKYHWEIRDSADNCVIGECTDESIAKLVAATPDLFEALSEILTSGIVQSRISYMTVRVDRKAWESAKAAIIKSEGGEHG